MDIGVKTEAASTSSLLGGHPPVVLPITLVSGQDLVVGAVLGKITASGKYSAYDNDASDGTQTAVAIIARDTDASGGDENTIAYFHGDFMDAALTWKDADARTAGIPQLLGKGIFVK